MAYIHKETFEIYDEYSMGYDTNEDLDFLFEVDDLLAPAISKLNLKGYTTKYCCQGHPFTRVDTDVITDLRLFMDELQCGESFKLLSTTKLSQQHRHVVYSYNTLHNMRTYIAFEDWVHLPSIPDGWELVFKYKMPILERISHCVSPLNFFKSLVSFMYDFGAYIDKLPFNDSTPNDIWNKYMSEINSKIPELNKPEVDIVIDGFRNGLTAEEVLSGIVTFNLD